MLQVVLHINFCECWQLAVILYSTQCGCYDPFNTTVGMGGSLTNSALSAGYCLSFDKSMTSKEVLASMNNKCAQTRKRFC